jgi:hypothetical protein
MADATIPLRIIISYAQHLVFPKIHNSTPRWAIITHQRAGKAVAAVDKLIRAAAACNRYGCVTPSLRQAEDISGKYLRQCSDDRLRGPYGSPR